MLYIQYIELKKKYTAAQEEYDSIINEKENLFRSTQPKGTDFSKEKVLGGMSSNPFDNYLIESELKEIDKRLEIARSILEARKMLFQFKEEELKLSKDVYDRVYVYKEMYRLQVYKVAGLVGYSEPQVYRILRKIKKNIKMIENESKNIVI
jgi:hypothetical protein